MKKHLIAIVFACASLFAKSQSASVEQSITGVQTGFISLIFYNESKLSDEITWRNELGLDGGILGGSFYDHIGIILTPVFSTEPRWYYNLDKRMSKSKKVTGNSGNFLSIKTIYYPDWFVISNYQDLGIISQISIAPNWGIRRQIGRHFNYETGVGIRYWYAFTKNYGYSKNYDGVIPHVTLRVGYSF